MFLSGVMHPVDTLYNITQAHSNKTQKPFPKLLKYFDQSKNQNYISFSQFEERVEIENDPTSKIAQGDHHYFPPDFHHIPAEKCKSNIMKHDSPWNNNFGNKKSTPLKKQGGCGEGERQKNKKTSKTKREKFVDVQVGILKFMIPQFSYLCDLEKAKQKRKRKA